MSKSTNTKQRELLTTQENAENNPKQNSTLAEREQIQGTPFTLIKTQEQQWFMVMGDYRVTETTKTKEEQIKKLESEKWLLIMHICIVAIEKINKTIIQPHEEKQEKQIETETLGK